MTDTRTYRTELIGPATLGLAGLAAPGRTWALRIDTALVATTDEPMTGEQAQHWAHRMLGEHVTFHPGDDHGSYWVANPDTPVSFCRPAPRATARRCRQPRIVGALGHGVAPHDHCCPLRPIGRYGWRGRNARAGVRDKGV